MSEKQTLRARLKEAVHSHSLFGKIEEVADKRRQERERECHVQRQHVLRLEKEFKTVQQSGAAPESLRYGNAEEALWLADQKLRRLRRKRDFWRKRYAWAHARHRHWGTVLKHRKDRLKRWIAQHEGFRPYMANGNPYEKLTPEARHAIYLDFRGGLYVTSTYEGHSGDGVHSTGSGHYLENQPDGKARCWDAGAGTIGPMEKAQRREAERAGSFMVELIGPANDCEYSNGVRYTLAEGSALETMHDNHKHTWIRDGAPTR